MDKWIIFDVDDVLCNFRESFYSSFKNLGKDIHWSQWTQYASFKMYGLKNEKELHEHMVFYNILENSKVEEGAAQLLLDFKSSGFKIGLLTARGWHKNGKSITENFVNDNNLCVDKIVISGLYKDKKSQQIDRFKGNVCGYIDDSTHHIEDFINQGVKNSYLINRPWNKDSNLPRIADFNQFKKIIIG